MYSLAIKVRLRRSHFSKSGDVSSTRVAEVKWDNLVDYVTNHNTDGSILLPVHSSRKQSVVPGQSLVDYSIVML